ncbi:hypothetical protein ASPZODRAFT_66967 [Penicilliopsis zonata CBS 506.65]|uniref:CENP-V/GFA domain-containing protein n=1 Tax=Penicilliopsis zonata CBS 506.65 TaxID=1073090 RepID=A0A1L9SGA2_9EURO|nr:hypothetical protein ASPZODRAFT_66967 [Penicilliopsis zonata CBS 506.65]OJJ46158.1 hypothetical protein ASPZODRAFT_66967 [Penicilliopsis zonata CBS 506.65]
MSYTGTCNCESIRITLPHQPSNTVLCYCTGCKKVGGREYILICSANYFVDECHITIDDRKGTLREYHDTKSRSGNAIRRFCSGCGSAIVTITPMSPGKAYLKASLFEPISAPGKEVFAEKKPDWMTTTLV